MEYLKRDFKKCEKIFQHPKKYKKGNILECMRRLLLTIGKDIRNIETFKKSYLFVPRMQILNFFTLEGFEKYEQYLKKKLHTNPKHLNNKLVQLMQGYVKMYIEFLNRLEIEEVIKHLDAFKYDLETDIRKGIKLSTQESQAYYYDEDFYKNIWKNPDIKEYAKVIRNPENENYDENDIINCLKVYLDQVLVSIHSKKLYDWETPEAPNIVKSFLFQELPLTIKDIHEINELHIGDGLDVTQDEERPPIFKGRIHTIFHSQMTDIEKTYRNDQATFVRKQYELMKRMVKSFTNILKTRDKESLIRSLKYFRLDLFVRHRFLFDAIYSGEIEQQNQEIHDFEYSTTSIKMPVGQLSPEEQAENLLKQMEYLSREQHKIQSKLDSGERMTHDEIRQLQEYNFELNTKGEEIQEQLLQLQLQPTDVLSPQENNEQFVNMEKMLNKSKYNLILSEKKKQYIEKEIKNLNAQIKTKEKRFKKAKKAKKTTVKNKIKIEIQQLMAKLKIMEDAIPKVEEEIRKNQQSFVDVKNSFENKFNVTLGDFQQEDIEAMNNEADEFLMRQMFAEDY